MIVHHKAFAGCDTVLVNMFLPRRFFRVTVVDARRNMSIFSGNAIPVLQARAGSVGKLTLMDRRETILFGYSMSDIVVVVRLAVSIDIITNTIESVCVPAAIRGRGGAIDSARI